MEIITSINYSPDRHTLTGFLKKDVKPAVMQLMNPARVRSMIDKKTIIQTIESVITYDWSRMLLMRGVLTGQIVHEKLTDNAWVHVHLITNSNKDKMVLVVSGQHNNVNHLEIGFVGDPDNLKTYLDKMSITQVEAYSNLIHLEE